MNMVIQWPVYKTARVTQKFGENPGSGYACRADGSHNGIDFGIPEGTPIYAAADGKVTRADVDNSGYGIHIRIQHDRFLTIYGHLRSLSVKAGDRVTAGQMIGESGNTGRSTGPHLHFEIRTVADNCRTCIDPMPYLTIEGKYRGVVTDEGNGLRIRTKPNTSGEIKGYLATGQIVDLMDIQGDWGRLVDAGERWVCLCDRARRVLYVQIDGQDDPEELQTWQEAVDAFLRSIGYNGPKPE